MEYTGVPIIVVCCYIFGEIFNIIFKKNKDMKKIKSIILSIIGAGFGVIIYYTNPEMVFNADNIWTALLIGIISGASSSGANILIQQIFKKGEKNNE